MTYFTLPDEFSSSLGSFLHFVLVTLNVRFCRQKIIIQSTYKVVMNVEPMQTLLVLHFVNSKSVYKLFMSVGFNEASITLGFQNREANITLILFNKLK